MLDCRHGGYKYVYIIFLLQAFNARDELNGKIDKADSTLNKVYIRTMTPCAASNLLLVHLMMFRLRRSIVISGSNSVHKIKTLLRYVL